MKILLPWVMLVFASIAQAKNVLLIGDSHSVGPYGQKLFELLKDDGHDVALYAHSSSAAIHWVSENPFKLSGGVLHQMSVGGRDYHHPNPVHWREKVETISFSPLLENMVYHKVWRKEVALLRAEHVVISLGANDYASLTDERGEYRKAAFEQRQKAILLMLQNVKECTWVLPPKMKNNHELRYEKLYRFLKDTIQNKCEIISSREFQSTGCDGIHFSCPEESYKAHLWAQKVFGKLKDIL